MTKISQLKWESTQKNLIEALASIGFMASPDTEMERTVGGNFVIQRTEKYILSAHVMDGWVDLYISHPACSNAQVERASAYSLIAQRDVNKGMLENRSVTSGGRYLYWDGYDDGGRSPNWGKKLSEL